MAGVPKAQGCDACRKQKKKVRHDNIWIHDGADEISVIRLNPLVHDAHASSSNAQESV